MCGEYRYESFRLVPILFYSNHCKFETFNISLRKINDMEDRYDISVDIGDGKDWWYVHGLTTHEKVYELNRQMCDLGKTMNDPMKPLSEEAIQEIAKALEITRNPKGIIMEKKTKKMTKAEAFEYLKEKKVDASINEREVQLKLFSIGVVWCTLDSKPTLGVSYLFIDKECHMTHCGSDFDYYKTHRYEKISADEILSIEIVDAKYELEFNYDKVVDLASPLMHYLNEVGFRDSIRVSQFGIVHEPMSTLIFDNGIEE